MTAKFTNNASTTLANSIGPTDTTIDLATGSGALFPSLVGTEYFYATLLNANQEIEIVKVTARTSDQVTVVRAQDGTSAYSHAAGSRFELRIVAGFLENVPQFDGVYSDPAWIDTLSAQKIVDEFDFVDYVLDADPAPAVGRTSWSEDDETLKVQLDAQLAHLCGQDTLYHVTNQTGSTITKGTLCVAAGTVGGSGKILVAPWNGTTQSKFIIGIAGEDILTENLPTELGQGFVVAFGKVRGIQTDGGDYSETWADGDILFPKPGGGLTKTMPDAPNSKATIAIVINASSNNGTLFVRPTLASSLNEDELVKLTTLTNGDILQYVSANFRFENKSLSSAGVQPTLVSGTNIKTVNSNSLVGSGDVAVGTVTSVGGTGTVNGISLSGTVTSSGNLTLGGALTGVSLTTQVTGTLPVANGGTGAATLTANNVLLGNGTSALQVVAPGTTGNVLTSNGTTWTSAAPSVGVGVTDDTSTNATRYLTFTSATSGNVSTVNVSSSKLTFNPSTGNLVVAGDVTSNSDLRLKSNIEQITGALGKVSALRGVAFDMENARRIGVIAQEVQNVVPEVVSTTEQGYLAVSYGNLVGLLIEAVKELSAEVAELKGKL